MNRGVRGWNQWAPVKKPFCRSRRPILTFCVLTRRFRLWIAKAVIYRVYSPTNLVDFAAIYATNSESTPRSPIGGRVVDTGSAFGTQAGISVVMNTAYDRTTLLTPVLGSCGLADLTETFYAHGNHPGTLDRLPARAVVLPRNRSASAVRPCVSISTRSISFLSRYLYIAQYGVPS